VAMIDPQEIAGAQQAARRPVREAAGDTQTDFATRIPTSRSTVANAETGHSSGTLDFWTQSDKALMETFAIQVEVCTDPEYAAVEGFVLDPARRAIVANWVGGDGLWHVGVTADRPTIRDYGDITGYAQAHSVVAGDMPRRRLRAFAEYLDLDWPWLIQRCAEIGEYGIAGFAEPRSRLLSVAGIDRACQYLSELSAADR